MKAVLRIKTRHFEKNPAKLQTLKASHRRPSELLTHWYGSGSCAVATGTLGFMEELGRP